MKPLFALVTLCHQTIFGFLHLQNSSINYFRTCSFTGLVIFLPAKLVILKCKKQSSSVFSLKTACRPCYWGMTHCTVLLQMPVQITHNLNNPFALICTGIIFMCNSFSFEFNKQLICSVFCFHREGFTLVAIIQIAFSYFASNCQNCNPMGAVYMQNLNKFCCLNIK